MKKSLLILITVCLFLLSGCSVPEKTSANDTKASLVVGFSQLGSESMWRIGNTRSVQEAAERANVNLMLDNAKQKQANQLAAIRSFIAYRVDVIVFSPIVEDGWDNVLREAKKAEIPVILMDRLINTEDDSLYAGYIGADFHAEGVSAGEYLLKKLESLQAENLNVVEITGTEDSTPMRQRALGFHEVVDQNTHVHMLESISGDFLTSKGNECMAYLLEKYGKEINVLYSHNDSMTIGAIDAIRAAGLEPGKDIIIITVDGEEAMIDLLRAGQVNCVVECTPYLGDAVMDMCKKLSAGQSFDKIMHPVEQVFTDFDDLSGIGPRGY